MQRLRWNVRNLLAITTFVACFSALVKGFELTPLFALAWVLIILQFLATEYKHYLPRGVGTLLVLACGLGALCCIFGD